MFQKPDFNVHGIKQIPRAMSNTIVRNYCKKAFNGCLRQLGVIVADIPMFCCYSFFLKL